MLVNTIDIVTYKAKLLTKNIQTAEITTFDDWLRNSLSPLYLGVQTTFKTIKLSFLIEDTTDEKCLINIGDLIRQLTRCVLKFDDLSFYYACTIGSKEHERLQLGYFTLNVELKSGWAYKPTVTETMTQVLSKTITVSGNMPTPAIVSLVVPINTISLTLTGFGSPIIINNLLANVPVIINGELDTILQNGSNKFGEADIWAFPKLLPGDNLITVDRSNSTITIEYKPKFN